MSKSKSIRVAVAQFHVGADIDKNLATCLRMLDVAGEHNPDLIVLPEFCNHLSWYNDKQHCFDVSVTLDGPFLAAIAAKAQELACYVVTNCTVQREDGSATGSSLLYSPQGELLLDNTKQIYIGHENDFLEKAKQPGQVIDTPIGRLGLYACMDGVINETPRCLALQGAQIMLNSLNSFATDEGSLHVPVRASENKAFVVAANKVGPLVPEEMLDGISAATGIPPKFLSGAGESQIVTPDGEVLARASIENEEVVFADIQVDVADNKCRPDGTDVFKSRRPELYKSIGEDATQQTLPQMSGLPQISAAIVQLAEPSSLSEEPSSLSEEPSSLLTEPSSVLTEPSSVLTEPASVLNEATNAVKQAFLNGACIVAIPSMLADLKSDAADSELRKAAQQSAAIIGALASVCDQQWVVTAAVMPCETGYQFCSVVVGSEGVVLKQAQIHHSERFAWSQPCNEIKTLRLPFGRIGLAASDDSIYPEYFRLLALAGVEVAVVPLQPLEAWELRTGLIERAAENRINLLVAAQSAIVNPALGASFSAALQTDFTIMTEWTERPFDGLLSYPVVQSLPTQAGVFMTDLYPANAANKVVSSNTDLLADRPWQLCSAITKAS